MSMNHSRASRLLYELQDYLYVIPGSMRFRQIASNKHADISWNLTGMLKTRLSVQYSMSIRHIIVPILRNMNHLYMSLIRSIFELETRILTPISIPFMCTLRYSCTCPTARFYENYSYLRNRKGRTLLYNHVNLLNSAVPGGYLN